jgi:hypothetical protein
MQHRRREATPRTVQFGGRAYNSRCRPHSGAGGDAEMETHVKVLGILSIVAGAMGLFSALILVVVFGGVAGAAGASGDAGAAIAVPIIGLTGLTLVFVTVVMSLPAVIIGWGLYTMRPWARVAGIVLSVLGLLAFPFGTALGVYGLWVLLSKDGERLFAAAPPTHA